VRREADSDHCTLVASSHHMAQLHIIFHAGIFPRMLSEIGKHPGEEEGGKYIGYLFGPGRLSIHGVETRKDSHTILVTDFLPSGPNAVRTAVEFMPDGEYQGGTFPKA
jgi:hypothetical protein